MKRFARAQETGIVGNRMSDQPPAQLTETLRAAPLFSGLESGLFGEFAAAARITQFERGEGVLPSMIRRAHFSLCWTGG